MKHEVNLCILCVSPNCRARIKQSEHNVIVLNCSKSIIKKEMKEQPTFTIPIYEPQKKLEL